MSGPTTILNSWGGVANRHFTDAKSPTVHPGYIQGSNPLLARSLASMMAMSPSFDLGLKESSAPRAGV